MSICPLLGVRGARWYPLYDLYAYSQDEKPSTSVSLHYRVNVMQDTGEDWKDAKLILSTSETDILNAGVPTPDGLVIEPKQPPLPPPQSPPRAYRPPRTKMTARKSTMFAIEAASEASLLSASDEDEDAEAEADGECGTYYCDSTESLTGALPEMSEGGAVVSKTPMAVNYAVDELTTIPSDDQSHKVLVAVIPLEATVSHITTPRKSPLAYLQVCPPPVSVYRSTYGPTTCSAR